MLKNKYHFGLSKTNAERRVISYFQGLKISNCSCLNAKQSSHIVVVVVDDFRFLRNYLSCQVKLLDIETLLRRSELAITPFRI